MQLELFPTNNPEQGTTVDVEEWRVIEGHEGYEVSSMGRFRNVRSGKFLSGTESCTGYQNMGFFENGKMKMSLAHRYVAGAFLEPLSKDHKYVNHKNKNRKDNRVRNLEWVTQSENMKHSWKDRKSKKSA